MPPGGDQKQARAYVPVDDESCVKWQIKWFPSKSIKEASKETLRGAFAEEAYDPPTNALPFGHVRMKANKAQRLFDELGTAQEPPLRHRRGELAGCLRYRERRTGKPILDRTQENLCAGDMTIIKARLMLLEAARALRDKGAMPDGARAPGVYRVRGCAVVIPDDVDWLEGARESMTVPALD